MNVKNTLFNIQRLVRNIRELHISCSLGGYEGPGKTTATILNKAVHGKLLIDKCTPMGFQLVNNTFIVSPIAIFPKNILCWNIASGKYINEASLSLFIALEPKPDLLILGLETQYPHSRIIEIRKILKREQIPVEVLPVERACGVYNFVCEEGRYVVAGLIPPKVQETVIFKKLQSEMKAAREEKAIGSN